MTNPYRTTYHRDGTVTIWDVYLQQWVRTSDPGDDVLASLSPKERARVERHLAKANLSGGNHRRLGGGQ